MDDNHPFSLQSFFKCSVISFKEKRPRGGGGVLRISSDGNDRRNFRSRVFFGHENLASIFWGCLI